MQPRIYLQIWRIFRRFLNDPSPSWEPSVNALTGDLGAPLTYQTSWIELRMQSRQVKLSISVASCIIENLTWFWICDDEYIVFTSFKTTQVLFKIFVNIGLIKRDSHTADQGLSRASKVAISFLHDLPVGHDTARMITGVSRNALVNNIAWRFVWIANTRMSYCVSFDWH